MRAFVPVCRLLLCSVALVVLTGCGVTEEASRPKAIAAATEPAPTGAGAEVEPAGETDHGERSATPANALSPQPATPSSTVRVSKTEPAKKPIIHSERSATLGVASPTPNATKSAAVAPADQQEPGVTSSPQPPKEDPISTPLASPTLAAKAVVAIESFAAEPSIAPDIGSVVHLAWEAEGDRAELCAIQCRPVSCQQVALTGEMTWVNDQDSTGYSGFALQVYSGGQMVNKSVQVEFRCDNLRSWFFDDPVPFCPQDEPESSYAAGQMFERGFMVWIEDTDELCVFENELRDTHLLHFNCISNPGMSLKPGASKDHRVGEEPPQGLHEPVSGFGLAWRGELNWPDGEDIRARLGWALGPEYGYETTWQFAISKCPSFWYRYLRGPYDQILVLRNATSIGWPLVWDYLP